MDQGEKDKADDSPNFTFMNFPFIEKKELQCLGADEQENKEDELKRSDGPDQSREGHPAQLPVKRKSFIHVPQGKGFKAGLTSNKGGRTFLGVSDVLKLSPLDQQHRDLGGRLVPFAGWEMPVVYSSIIEEHETVRKGVGLFDISHMGQVFVSGGMAEEWLNRMLSNDVSSIEAGNAQYTFLLNRDGGVIDDLIIYRLDEEQFLLVVNAAKIEEDVKWLYDHREEGVEIKNDSSEWAGLAIQGRKASEAYFAASGGRTLPKRNGVDDLTMEGSRFIVCRTGYTGEDGFELFCPKSMAAHWWESFISEGVKPCGLAARDSLRLEMCYPLNGSDLSPERTPLEAGLGFFVSLEKDEFIGKESLENQKEGGLKERLVAIEALERGAPPRAGYSVFSKSGEALGVLTSGGMSPSLGKGIALGYLPVSHAKIGTEVDIEIRGKKISAKVVKKPFYRK